MPSSQGYPQPCAPHCRLVTGHVLAKTVTCVSWNRRDAVHASPGRSQPCVVLPLNCGISPVGLLGSPLWQASLVKATVTPQLPSRNPICWLPASWEERRGMRSTHQLPSGPNLASALVLGWLPKVAHGLGTDMICGSTSHRGCRWPAVWPRKLAPWPRCPRLQQGMKRSQLSGLQGETNQGHWECPAHGVKTHSSVHGHRT